MLSLVTMRRVFGVILLSWGLCMKMDAQSNEGTQFWAGFMEKFELGQEERVLMITSKFSTTGSVEIPGLAWREDFEVTAQEVTLISIPDEAVPRGSEAITPTGIFINSLQPVVVYAHQFEQNRAEASVILPTTSLGTDYFTMCYRGYSREEQGVMVHYPSEFLIVATENNTTIQIRVTSPTRGGLQTGDVRSLVLNAGESYQVQSLLGDTHDLTGSEIQADKPIAVFSGNLWTQTPNGCGDRDNLYEQLYPTQSWGKQFAVAPQRRTNGTLIRILASQDNSPVTVQGDVVLNQTLNRGEFLEFELSGSAFISSDNPILATQFSKGRSCSDHPNQLGDPAMVLLNSLEQTRDSVTLFASTFRNIEENFINVLVRTQDIPEVRLDGELVSSLETFTPISGNPDYSYAQIPVSPGTHNLSSDGCGINATLYGYGEAESYAYAAGANFPTVNPEKLRELTGGCVDEAITFDSGLSEKVFTFSWDFGDGSSSTLPIPEHTYTSEGDYTLTLEVVNVCLNTQETYQQNLSIASKPIIQAGNDTTLCINQPMVFTASFIQDASYAWEGPSNFSSSEIEPMIPIVGILEEGTYEVIATLNGCESLPAQTQVEIWESPLPELGLDTVLCEGTSFTRSPGEFVSYLWQDGSTASQFTFSTQGTFWVEVIDSIGCLQSDTLRVEEGCPVYVYIPSAFSPNGDGLNDVFGVVGDQFESFSLEIYDRWGQKVYSTQQPRGRWDGSLPNGNQAPEGIYTWLILFSGLSEEGSPFTQKKVGTLTLIR